MLHALPSNPNTMPLFGSPAWSSKIMADDFYTRREHCNDFVLHPSKRRKSNGQATACCTAKLHANWLTSESVSASSASSVSSEGSKLANSRPTTSGGLFSGGICRPCSSHPVNDESVHGTTQSTQPEDDRTKSIAEKFETLRVASPHPKILSASSSALHDTGASSALRQTDNKELGTKKVVPSRKFAVEDASTQKQDFPEHEGLATRNSPGAIASAVARPGAFLKELSKSEYSKLPEIALGNDLVNFSILGSECRPSSQSTWVSKAPQNSIHSTENVKILIRRHLAEKLNASPRSFGLFCVDYPSGRFKLEVRVALDPYIRLLVEDQMHVLDFSRCCFNKSCLTIGEIKRSAEEVVIGDKRQHRVHLFIDGKPMRKDSIMLKDTGLLSEQICQGWRPLFIRATLEIEEKECVVCGDELPFDMFPQTITRMCDHETKTCQNCLQKWIQAALTSNGWDKIKCPECKAIMQHDDLYTNASSALFEKYDQLAMRAALSAIPDFRWCLSSSCQAGQIHESGIDGPIFSCHACDARHCVIHEIDWHDGETCEQYDYRVSGHKKRDEEKASEKTIQSTTKSCPKCTAHIEKSYGCDHMTCCQCQYEFCWVCFAEYEPIRRLGNHLHEPTCAHYRM